MNQKLEIQYIPQKLMTMNENVKKIEKKKNKKEEKDEENENKKLNYS